MNEEQAGQVAALVRRARRSRQWTGDELAAAAGVAPGTVVRIENGRPVRPGNLRAVLDALDIAAPPTGDSRPVDSRIQLALDITRKYLEAVPEEQLDAAVMELTRFLVLR